MFRLAEIKAVLSSSSSSSSSSSLWLAPQVILWILSSSKNPFHSSRARSFAYQFHTPNIPASSSPSSLLLSLRRPLFLLPRGCASYVFSLISWSSFLMAWPAHLSLVNLMLLLKYSLIVVLRDFLSSFKNISIFQQNKKNIFQGDFTVVLSLISWTYN